MKKSINLIVVLLLTIIFSLSLTSCATAMDGLGGLNNLGSKIMDINESDNKIELFADEGYGEIIDGKSYYMREFLMPENSPYNAGEMKSQIMVNDFSKNNVHKVYIERVPTNPGYFYIKASDSDLVWSLENESYEEGTAVLLSKKSGYCRQKFLFELTDDEDVYLIRAKGDGYLYNDNGRLVLAEYNNDNEVENNKLKWHVFL